MTFRVVSGLSQKGSSFRNTTSNCRAAVTTNATIRRNGLVAAASTNSGNDAGHVISKSFLLQQAANVRRTLVPVPATTNSGSNSNEALNTSEAEQILSQYSSSKSLFYPTFYSYSQDRYIKKAMKQRGFSNWLVPNRIMVGQYPGQTPETHGPSLSSVTDHIESLIVPPTKLASQQETNNSSKNPVCLFCSLQSEIPPQDDYKTWIQENGGKIYLPSDGGRKEFPNYFGHYAPIVQGAFEKRQTIIQRSGRRDMMVMKKDDDPPRFLHAPILDLGTPSSASLYSTLSTLLETLEEKPDFAIYIHCWGGRGRAGLVGACLLALLFPELDSDQILNWVQRGYDTRLGADDMPIGLKQSPQTFGQRDFVKSFVKDVRSLEGGV